MVQADNDIDIDLQQDLPQALNLLSEMNQNVVQVSDLVENMLAKVKNGELSTEYGLSFIEIKYQMLLTYLINLTYVVLRKCTGERIEKDPSIDRLIEIRTILEKIRPIDYKLRYQIDKLVKTAITGHSGNTSDPIAYKPNPNNLISQFGDDDDDDDSDSDDEIKTKSTKKKKSKSSDIYVPPKISAVRYDEEDTKAERNRKQVERARKRALNSSIVQDLKEEYLDIPIEISSSSRAQQIISKTQKERQEYEETYMTRLPITKADKHKQKRLSTLGSLGSEITSFGAFNEDITKNTGNKRKRKVISKKKKGGKKRKFH